MQRNSPRRTSAISGAVLWLAIGLVAGVAPAQAQVDPTPTTPGSMPTPSSAMSPPGNGMTLPRINESLLETIYLRDEEGNFIPTINAFTLEELQEFLKQKQAAMPADAPRPFSIQALDLDVRIDPDRVASTAIVTVKLNRGGWTGVPLRFDRMLLEAAPTWKTAREVDLEYKEGEGWVAWIEGDQDAVVEMTLTLASTDRSAFEDQAWKATLPTAAVSRAKFSIAGGPWEGVEAPRAILPGMPAFADGRTSISALGLVGDATLSWSKRVDSDDSTATYEAQETARVTVDSPTQATCESSFLVQSLEGPARTVFVLLPERTALVPPATAPTATAATVALASPQERESVLPAGTVGTLLRVEAPSALASFRFAISYRVTSSQPGRLAIERPRMVRAVRQSGTVEVVGSDDWNLDWTPRGSLQRVDRSADDVDDETSNASALFHYSQAPAPLEIVVAPRKSQLIVDPVVLFDVGRRETLLDLRLTCRFQGVGELAVRLPGWTVLDVGPATLVDMERLDLQEVDPLRVPFVPDAGKDRGEVELRITATRRRPEGEKRLELPIPRIDDAVVNAALIAVQAADDVQIAEIAGETRGLTPDIWSPETRLEERQQTPLVYRDYGDVSDARIVLSAETRNRELSVDERSELTVRADGASLEQRFAVQSSYGALDQFDLWIPAERLLDDRPLSATLNGKAVVPRFIQDVNVTLEAPLVPPEGMRRMRIDVTPPRAGLTTIALAWDIPVREEGASERIRLARAILPPDVDRAVQPAVALAIAPARITLDPDRWQSTGAPDGEASTERFVAGDAAGLQEIAFERTLRAATPHAVPRVERSWLHTEALSNRLHHRYAIQIRNAGDSLTIQMPSAAIPVSASPASTVVAWNGAELPFEALADGTLVAELAPQAAGGAEVAASVPSSSGTLEIWYEEPRRHAWGGFASSPPRISSAEQAAPFYWSVRFPPEETILASPAGMQSETAWRWSGWRFERGPAIGVADLERWSGATMQPQATEDRDAYVFSASEPPETVGATTLPRNAAFLAYGLCAFVIGLAWIYVPAVRRPWAALAVATLLVALAFWAPERALPAAEVAAYGLAVVAIAAGVDWWLHGRAGRASSVRSVATPRRGASEHGLPAEEKRETESLQAERAEIGA